jgi:GNAT superfamily N-acetyltransferase
VIKADPGSITLCGFVNGKVVAFIAGSSRVGGGSEIILNGVHREAEGKGYYSALLSAYLEQAARRGDKHVIVSTQLQNIRVQRVWSRHGLELDQSYYTFHRWAD